MQSWQDVEWSSMYISEDAETRALLQFNCCWGPLDL